MSHEYEVWWRNTTGVGVPIELEDEVVQGCEDTDELIEEVMLAAEDNFDYPSLCHHCGRERNDGEWEIGAIVTREGDTDSPKTIWEDCP